MSKERIEEARKVIDSALRSLLVTSANHTVCDRRWSVSDLATDLAPLLQREFQAAMGSNHPPIPQTLPPGVSIDELDGELVLSLGGSRRLTKYKPIIAAVARCASLDLDDVENAEAWRIWSNGK